MDEDWRKLISQPEYNIKKEKDVFVPMRDGIRLAVDVYRPDARGKFPALIALSPYGKELQELALTFPPQARPSNLWDGCIEAGDMGYIVPRGYAHVIADSRGTGHSEGQYAGISGVGGNYEGRDGYDLVEWLARQLWCDGNIGMIGISYYAVIQIQTAAERPPHLKAIFPFGGSYNIYRMNYHGGIFWVMLRAAIDGRGGDSGFAVKNITSAMKKNLTGEEFERRLEERLNDPDIRNYPNFYHLLKYPEKSPIFLDLLLNPLDGPFYWEGEASSMFHKVEIPVYTGVNWGRAWFVDEALNCYLGVSGPKKLLMMPFPPMIDRPFHELHDLMIRWYDHWLKGIDTGLMDEPPISISVGGVNEWRHEHEWPLSRTKWTDFYLRPRGRLSPEPEPLDTSEVPPDGFYQAPPTVTDVVNSVRYATLPLTADMELTGPIALYLQASIDTDDTNWMIKLNDVEPSGRRIELSTGWLKASHRELNEARSTPWKPYHPHTRSVPATPGEIVEYAIPIGPISNVFRAGHRLELEIKSVESMNDPALAILAPDSFHLNSSRATTHKIYRDRSHPSRLLLPVI